MTNFLLSTFNNLTFLAWGIQGDTGAGGAAAPAAADVVAATADAASGAAAGGGGMGTMPMIFVWIAAFGAMYFFLFRPQRKREKQMREMQQAIKTGDNIVTSGGLFGKISDVGTDCFMVEFGTGGRTVRMAVLKSDVVSIREPIMTPPPKEAE
ncbi:MAG: preprotein translocase subunit YajC [Defluviitaleaceae bacterium]|nr:preprotein translocase subunit YajC [Defluviitaleaceae bacterium]